MEWYIERLVSLEEDRWMYDEYEVIEWIGY